MTNPGNNQLPSQDVRDLLSVTLKLTECLNHLYNGRNSEVERLLVETVQLQGKVVARWKGEQ